MSSSMNTKKASQSFFFVLNFASLITNFIRKLWLCSLVNSESREEQQSLFNAFKVSDNFIIVIKLSELTFRKLFLRINC